ncbi:hypothetical protein RSAG8_02399, partial [Rhizoctonia solani AG-8 WAC10335]
MRAAHVAKCAPQCSARVALNYLKNLHPGKIRLSKLGYSFTSADRKSSTAYEL